MPDPYPDKTFRPLPRQSPIMQPDPCRPEWTSYRPKTQGTEMRFASKQDEVLVGQRAHRLGKLPVVKPESRGGKVLHSGVQRPASKSASACAMR